MFIHCFTGFVSVGFVLINNIDYDSITYSNHAFGVGRTFIRCGLAYIFVISTLPPDIDVKDCYVTSLVSFRSLLLGFFISPFQITPSPTRMLGVRFCKSVLSCSSLSRTFLTVCPVQCTIGSASVTDPRLTIDLWPVLPDSPQSIDDRLLSHVVFYKTTTLPTHYSLGSLTSRRERERKTSKKSIA